MPKRSDIKSVLIIGAGPIVIGQACEFDYSGAQACKALREEGYRVILVNSNPATIMTDPEMADAIYIEPIQWDCVANIIEKERPDVILPTMGGQTALNCALDLEREGILEKYDVEMIGAKSKAIDMAEDRLKFRKAMEEIGLASAPSDVAHTMEEAREVLKVIGFPMIIRPSFTMGGSGGGIAYNQDEFEDIVARGLDLSPTTEVLLEESLLGWKEYEMEVVRDHKDNCIIICAIENLDPMGIHTGDSITVAPAQTLTDKEYQIMRNASLAVLRKIGVDTGGSNVQFSINPEDGRMVIIEMNPRVSRSSALASKATGFPIARIAAKLAVGYTLDELRNEITGDAMPASFEPSIDYVVTKIPRFTFEKFPQADDRLTTQMKSVGEVMAIGRTFQESFQKALRGLETGIDGLANKVDLEDPSSKGELRRQLTDAGSERILYLGDAMRFGMSNEELFELTSIDPWFLAQIKDLITTENDLSGRFIKEVDAHQMRQLKRKGFSDRQLAGLLQASEKTVRQYRQGLGVRPIYKRVDTCAAEFSTDTAYLYSSYDEECESQPTDKEKIIILGGGPNRIGQGIEFDYCCVHAAFAMRDDGYETIMINCNPETVSTDYDTSDRLYFEPLTLEDVLEIVHIEKPKGLIVQYGGQTPLKLAEALEAAGAPIIGTSPDAIDLAEDRERFQQLIEKLGLKQPPNRTARDLESSVRLAKEIGYPLVVRPSYVLGGRGMEIVHTEEDLRYYMQSAIKVSNDSPVLLDRFLDDAIEVDIDAICDGKDVLIGGIMQHIEQAGVHSGDSACSLPPYSLSTELQDELRKQMTQLGLALQVVGLMNAQFAIKGEEIYILEVNPRASRTVPFVSKATGRPLAKIAALCMAGKSLEEQGELEEIIPTYYSVKEAVFPFAKFQGVDPVLSPEMKSTGEVMGVGSTFGEAFGKAQYGAGVNIPTSGTAFLSVREADRVAIVDVARSLSEQGFDLLATRGTKRVLEKAGIDSKLVNKVREGRPHIVDIIKNKAIDLIVNTTEGKQSTNDSSEIRSQALHGKVTYSTTISGALALCESIKYVNKNTVYSLQNLHKGIL
ncbi:MAG: carbamoyl-phosphate synthase large subunit [Thiotrichaceae bacterium]|nr:carbamoyl-phosphate synthase large subunit [Thiotrichaceae bacterium]